jgi:hypothetical protein
MTPERSAAQDVVYGDLNGSLVFIPKRRADHLAAIHAALWSSSTWREVHDRMPPGAYEELLEISGATELLSFEDYYEDERRSRPDLSREEARAEYLALSTDELRPELDDPFQAGDIGAICDGDWPGWTAQEMLAWVPKAIQEQYGRRGFSFVSGDCLVFRPEDEDELVAAFLAHGHACVRDDTLVRRASGYGT